MNEVIFKIFNADLIDTGVRDAVAVSIKLGAILAPLFFLGNVAFNFAATTVKNFGVRPTTLFDRMELIRACVLWFILTAGYVPIFGSIAKLGDTLGRYSYPTSTAVAGGKSKIAEKYNYELNPEPDGQKQNNNEKSKDEAISIFQFLKNGWNFIVLSISGAFWGLLSVIVRAIVLMFAIILAKIFYAIGPVVIAFSILPVFKDKFAQWSGVYLNCLCVPFTMNLLDTIIFSVVDNAWAGDEVASPYSITIFGVCMTICYALSFWITSFYCGSSGASKVLSTFVATATQAANLALGGAGKGGTASEPGKGNSPNIIEDSSKNQQPPTK